MIGRIVIVILIIALAASVITPIANITTGQITQGSVTTSGPPTGNSVSCSSFWSAINAQMTPSFDAETGHKDSKLTGKTVTNINLYLCSHRIYTNQVGCIGPSSGCCPLPANDTQTVNVGIYDSGTGALVQSFGTVGIQSLPCWCGQAVTCPTTGQAFSFSGSHVMLSNEMVGLKFSFTQDSALVMCQGNCVGTENPTGAAVDCAPGCVSSNGFGLAGPFTYLGIKNQNMTSSPGIAVLSVYPIFFMGIGLVAIWIIAKPEEHGIG